MPPEQSRVSAGQDSPLGRRSNNLWHVIVIEAAGHEGGAQLWHIVDKLGFGRIISAYNGQNQQLDV
jgi:hypothetical protein